jgi:hypothetical protein
MHKSAPLLVACLLAMAAAGASAQSIWKWRDANGQMHVSDTPPPSNVPDKNIIQRGNGATAAAVSVAPAAQAASEPVAAASGVDSDLQKKKAKADKEKAEKEAADKEAADKKNASIRAENCQRAQQQAAALQSGVRVAQYDAQGERHFLDDDQRASELKRAQDIIAQNCR